MRFLFATDIHASHNHLFSMLEKAEMESVDAIAVGGDIVPHYLPDFANRGILEKQALYLQKTMIPALEKFKRKNGAKIFLDMGNDDFLAGRHILENRRGDLFELLHMEVHRFSEETDIVGYMNVPPTPFGRKDWEKPDSKKQLFAPGNIISTEGAVSGKGYIRKTVLDLDSEKTIEADLEFLCEKIRRPFVFVSHAPPYNTNLDVMYNGLHVGSLAVREFIEKWAANNFLIASFHGHIHESPDRTGSVATALGPVSCYNPGQGNGLGARFRYLVATLSEQKISVASE